MSIARHLRPLATPAGLVALVLATRLPRLDRPRVFVFDEVYYVLDAADLLRHGVESSPAHPSLAKWLIAGGIRVFGFSPIGWRSATLLAGIALVLVTWAAARRITDRPDLALAAGALVALDGIAFVTGRLALLDGFVALATTAAAGCVLGALADRTTRSACAAGAGRSPSSSASAPDEVGGRLDLAGGRHRARQPGALLRAPGTGSTTADGGSSGGPDPGSVGGLRRHLRGLVRPGRAPPGGLVHCHGKLPCPLSPLDRVTVWFDHQRMLVDFHANLDTDNPEAAPACAGRCSPTPPTSSASSASRRWPTRRPPRRRGLPDRDEPTQVRVLALANPVSWAAGLLGLGVSAFLAVRRRDDAAGIVLGLAAAQWLPWMLSGREVYSYYAVSLVPLLALATVLALDRLPRVRRYTLVPLLVVRPRRSSSSTRCWPGWR